MAWPTSAYPTSLDSPTDKVDLVDDVIAADVNGCYDAIEHIEAKLGVDSSAITTSIDYLLKNTSSSNPGHKHTLANGATDVTATAAEINAVCQTSNNGFFSSGRKVWLYEDVACTGWTIVAAAADAVLAVKGGSNAYNVSGGTQAGTWTQPTHIHPDSSPYYAAGGTFGSFNNSEVAPANTWRPLAQVGIIVSKD